MTTEPHIWIKSSYSGSGGTCVEWAPARAATTGIVPVRDSKDPGLPGLALSTSAFTAFVTGVKSGTLGAL